jgi:hypothetical protein
LCVLHQNGAIDIRSTISNGLMMTAAHRYYYSQ